MSLIRNILFLLVTLTLISCQEDPISVDPGDLTLAERQNLGDVLLDAIKSDESNIGYYASESFPDMQKHFDQLYRQVYQIDRDIAGWDTNHKPEVLVIRNSEQIATCLPGGHFIISQGLANLFTYEYELVYVMAFEYNLMNERSLLDNIAQFVENSAELRSIAKNGDKVKAIEIALEILYNQEQFIFESDVVSENDKLTVNTICSHTNYKVDGLQAFHDDLISTDHWSNTRKSGSRRITNLVDYMVETGCTGEDRNRWTSKGEFYYQGPIKNFLN